MRRIFLTLFMAAGYMFGTGQDLTVEDYINQYKEIAIHEMRRSGVPAAITLAQGILESGSGNSDLVRQSNNHFGIKCKSNWSGPYVLHDDDLNNECFRAYDDAVESYVDHSDFLRKQPRYSALFQLDPRDYKGWAVGLKKAGYATNPQYANLLISKIEDYGLDKYTLDGLLVGIDDSAYMAMSRKSMEPENMGVFPAINRPREAAYYSHSLMVTRINNLLAVTADSGTSLLSISKQFVIPLQKLIEWNELSENIILGQSQIIYLQEKMDESSRANLVFSKDLTLYQIAQSQGVNAAVLSKINNIGRDEVVPHGTVVFMQLAGDRTHLEETAFVEDARFHMVQPKEGLFSIARKYGTTVDQLKRWNGLTDDQLHIGQKLIVLK